MSEESYDVPSHQRQALRMVYQARSSVAHLDAAVIGEEELRVAQDAIEVLQELEELMEERVGCQCSGFEWTSASAADRPPATAD